MGFQVPSPFGVNPTEGEELFKRSWEVFGDNVLSLINEGWDYALVGKSDMANKSFQAANIYFYFVFVAQAARYTLEMLGKLDENCNSIIIDEKYGLSCIEGNMPCLSDYFQQDYRSAWDSIMSIFGIDRQLENCDSCCVGIGEMIIEDNNECIAFIVGPCNEIEDYEPDVPEQYGEFKLGEFKTGEFTNFNE